MLDVMNPTLKRQLQIIQYLYKNRGKHGIKELMKLVKVSELTIRSDMNQINTDFPSLHIEIHSKGQVELIYPENVGIEYIYRRIMHLSLEIAIFEYLLNKPSQSKKFYMKKLFISETLFRKVLQKWNKFFKKKKLDVSITVSPVVSVEGDEVAIRSLYYHCLVEKYMGDSQYNFFEKDNSIWELIARLGNIFSVEIPYSSHLKLSYWFFVCIQRMKQGYYIKKEYIAARKNVSQSFYNEISNDFVLKKQFMHDHQIELSIGNLLDIIGVYDLDLLMAEHLTKDISKYEQKEKGLFMVAVKDFLLSFYESIHYENAFFEQTLALVYAFLTLQCPTPFFFYNHYGEFREYIKKENPFFLEMFEVHLERSTLPSYLKENDELKNEFLYHVVIHTGALVENFPRVAVQKKILILTTFHKDYMNSMKKKLKSKFTESVLVSIYNSRHPQLDLGYLKKFDIILTNYEHLSSELDSRIIYVDIGTSAEFLEKVKSKLK